MIGDQNNMVSRLKAALPKGWFSGATPVLDAVLNGAAYGLSFVFSLISYAKLQTRIKTATDGFLDLVSFDYFGTQFPRRPNESDAQFLVRILQNLLREKATRNGMIKVLTDLTGYVPRLFEPWRPLDCGAWNQDQTFAYNTIGGWGNLNVPYQCFITAYRPLDQGIANVAGWTNPEGAWNTGSQIEYANLSQIAGQVTDADINAAIADNKPEGTIAWTQITNHP